MFLSLCINIQGVQETEAIKVESVHIEEEISPHVIVHAPVHVSGEEVGHPAEDQMVVLSNARLST